MYLRRRKMQSMTTENKNYCVMLAGGMGRRLWPVSRERLPKQFIDFFGVGRTQLQQTFDRFARLLPANHIFVSTNEEYAALIREQLPELPERNVLLEPIFRNTAPSVAWACYRISHLCADARIIVTPSDHAVVNEDAFAEDVERGFDFVSGCDGMLTLGVKPTRPEPGYGYVQLGEEVQHGEVFRIKSFTEKPEREFARLFMESGEFYWNTGIFFFNVTYMIKSLKKLLPVVMRRIDYEGADVSWEEELEYVRKNFPRYPNLSIDHGILERLQDVYVMRGDFGWADLGTWHSAFEAMSTSADDNVVIDSEVMIEESKGNIIKIPHDHLAVINGLEGYIVAEQGNVLFICKKEDSSALVRKYINEVKLKYGEGFV